MLLCAAFQVFDKAIEEAVRHRNAINDKIQKGEFEDLDLGGGDLAVFKAEVDETLKYFDEVQLPSRRLL